MNANQKTLIGVFLICATYVYFLIYAQFAFLDQLALAFPDAMPDAVLAAMGLSGLTGSLVTGLRLKIAPIRPVLIWSFAGCAVAAVLTPFASGLIHFSLLAVLMGFALGTETAALATFLPALGGGAHFGRMVGLGTGLAYLICNMPMLFAASPQTRSWTAALFVIIAGALVMRLPVTVEQDKSPAQTTDGLTSADFKTKGFVLILLCFTALIWLDSALFYIIQQTQTMKALTWSGTSQKWMNGVVHLIAAVISGYLIDMGRFQRVLPAAFVFLAAGAGLLILGSGQAWAAPLYVVGVSLYSTALVAFPGLGREDQGVTPVRLRAAWIYGVAGWVGSAMGIGMARDLNRIPIAFLVISGLVILAVHLYRARGRSFSGAPLTVVGLVLCAGLCIRCDSAAARPNAANDAVARGRQVYIDEGCIHCHSQYVRPGTPDEDMWGPHVPPDQLMIQNPPLFGNRRQGPDLLNVGNRRGPIWQKQHLINPRELNPFSTMPAYAYLFQDRRGDDLVAYLNHLGVGTVGERMAVREHWEPDPGRAPISVKQAAGRFKSYCAPCHGADGKGNGPLADHFPIRPANLVTQPFHLIDETAPDKDLKLARLIKYGFPGTEMPGHETLSDDEILGLVAYIRAIRNPEMQVEAP